MAVTNFIPELWAGAIVQSFKEAEILSPVVNRSYEGTAVAGNQVNITGITTPTVQNYATNHTHTNDTLSDTTTALAISQEKAIAFLVDDVDRVQAAGSFDQVTSDAAAALVEDAENYIIDQMVAGGTAVDNTAVTDGAGAYSKVMLMRTALGNAKVPMANRYLLVNPEFAGLLLASNLLGTANFTGDQLGVRNGVIGTFLGFTVLESSLLTAVGGEAAIAFHGPSVAYVNQIQTVEALRAPTSFADIVRLLHVYGAQVLRATAVQTFIPAA